VSSAEGRAARKEKDEKYNDAIQPDHLLMSGWEMKKKVGFWVGVVEKLKGGKRVTKYTSSGISLKILIFPRTERRPPAKRDRSKQVGKYIHSQESLGGPLRYVEKIPGHDNFGPANSRKAEGLKRSRTRGSQPDADYEGP